MTSTYWIITDPLVLFRQYWTDHCQPAHIYSTTIKRYFYFWSVSPTLALLRMPHSCNEHFFWNIKRGGCTFWR